MSSGVDEVFDAVFVTHVEGWNFETCHISEATAFTFGMQIDYKEYFPTGGIIKLVEVDM